MRSCAIMIVVAGSVAGCKAGYEPQRFVDVCTAGKGYSGAAAYDPSASPGGGEVTVAFVYKSADVEDWYVTEFLVPDAMKAGGVVPVKSGNQGKAQLALCIEQQPGAFRQDCSMNSMNATIKTGGGGGTPDVDVQSTGRTLVVKAYDSRYVLTAREARTGRVLATRTLDVPSRMCPIMAMQATVGETRDYTRIGDRDLVELLAPLLPEPVRAKVLAAPIVDPLF